jgi:hypothetical protein
MYAGYVFPCNSTSLKECVRQKLLSCSNNTAIAQEVGEDSVIFLLDADSDTLVGPFSAVGPGRTHLEPGTWTETIDNHSISGNIKVEWEELHEMKTAKTKFPFLENGKICQLSHFQTQDLLNALKQAAVFHEK